MNLEHPIIEDADEEVNKKSPHGNVD